MVSSNLMRVVFQGKVDTYFPIERREFRRKEETRFYRVSAKSRYIVTVL